MKSGTQAALSAVVKKSNVTAILKDSTSDFPDYFDYWLKYCNHAWEPLWNGMRMRVKIKNDYTADQTLKASFANKMWCWATQETSAPTRIVKK